MASLVARPGDVQALRAAISAKFSGIELTFTAASCDVLRAKASNPFGTNVLACTTSSGVQLTSPNTIVKILGMGGDLCNFRRTVFRYSPGSMNCPRMHHLPACCIMSLLCYCLP